MNIQGIERVSMVDFENKICATIFTGGCNFRCPFCHNAQIVNQEFDKITEEEVLEYLVSRKKLLDGVTISGGEPTLQPDLVEFARKVKNLGYQIKLDTNATLPSVIETLAKEKLLDYVAIDIKNAFSHYNRICGVASVDISKIKESLSILKYYKIPYELRTTLVKGFHTKETIEKMATDLEGEEKLFLQKFVDSGACMQNKLSPIPKDEAKEFVQLLSKKVKNVQLRGY